MNAKSEVKKLSKITVISLVLILLLCSSIVFTGENKFSNNESMTSNYPSSLLTASESIYISDNVDFLLYGFNGTGTPEDPFRIENLSISTTDYNGIYITDITKHFVILNCIITADMVGIQIDDVAPNITTIQNNSCNGMKYMGIEIKYSLNCTISNNICSGNQRGIKASVSPGVIIVNNTCDFNVVGIEVSGSPGCVISDNSCVYNRNNGISCRYSDSSSVINNFCKNNWGDGISLYSLTTCRVINNTCISNSIGIDSAGLYFSDISYNLFLRNTGFGIKIAGYKESLNITIHHNLFLVNSGMYLTADQDSSQALDDDGNNYWYNPANLEGNYWSNYDNIGIYSINGTANAQDLFPLIANDTDDDGLDNIIEQYVTLTNWLSNDTDSDLLLDGQEVLNFSTDPTDSDTDNDMLKDGEEVYIHFTDPLLFDTDIDGLSDGDEILVFLTNPLNSDSDADSIPDGWEVVKGLNPLVDDAAEDPDEDGLTNLEEYLNYANPFVNDTDSDGLLDGEEVNIYLTCPYQPDSDRDDLLDGEEVLVYFSDPMDPDTDDDGLDDGEEILIHGTNVTNPDTENDGMPDGWEIKYAFNPLVDDSFEDPDEDGLTNVKEYQAGTNPHNNDTDGDTFSDGYEVRFGGDPLDPFDYPLRAGEIAGIIVACSFVTLSLIVLVTITILKKKGINLSFLSKIKSKFFKRK